MHAKFQSIHKTSCRLHLKQFTVSIYYTQTIGKDLDLASPGLKILLDIVKLSLITCTTKGEGHMI